MPHVFLQSVEEARGTCSLSRNRLLGKLYRWTPLNTSIPLELCHMCCSQLVRAHRWPEHTQCYRCPVVVVPKCVVGARSQRVLRSACTQGGQGQHSSSSRARAAGSWGQGVRGGLNPPWLLALLCGWVGASRHDVMWWDFQWLCRPPRSCRFARVPGAATRSATVSPNGKVRPNGNERCIHRKSKKKVTRLLLATKGVGIQQTTV